MLHNTLILDSPLILFVSDSLAQAATVTEPFFYTNRVGLTTPGGPLEGGVCDKAGKFVFLDCSRRRGNGAVETSYASSRAFDVRHRPLPA